MGQFDLFRKLNTIRGTTSKEKITNEKIREFDKYIVNAPNRFEVNIDNSIDKYLIAMQDVTFNNKNGDEKYIVTGNSTIVKVGSMFNCLNNTWVVVERENNTLQDHQSFKVRPTNNTLRFKHEDIEHSIPAIITNQTLYTVGIKEGKFFDAGDTKLSCVLGMNGTNMEDTKWIFRGMRFLFDSNGRKIAYKITYIDTLSVNGLLTCTLQESGDKQPADDLVNGIAQNIYPKQ